MIIDPVSYSQEINDNPFLWAKYISLPVKISLLDPKTVPIKIRGLVNRDCYKACFSMKANNDLKLVFVIERESAAYNCVNVYADLPQGYLKFLCFSHENMDFNPLTRACFEKDDEAIILLLEEMMTTLVHSATDPEMPEKLSFAKNYIYMLSVCAYSEDRMPKKGRFNHRNLYYNQKQDRCMLSKYISDMSEKASEYLNKIFDNCLIPDSHSWSNTDMIAEPLSYANYSYIKLKMTADIENLSAHDKLKKMRELEEFKTKYPEAPF